MTMNVVLELVNYEFLLANNTLHQIAYRNNANQCFSFEHREMADAPVGHQCHALFNRLFWPRDKDVRLHNLANRRLRRGSAFQKTLRA